jgi:hypothetical protein
MSYLKVVLILGSGPNVGQHVARAFAAKGYKVAVASRTVKKDDSIEDQVGLQIDLSDPSSVPNVFNQVKEKLGTPSVVVYNGRLACQTCNMRLRRTVCLQECSGCFQIKRPQKPLLHLSGRPLERLKYQHCQYIRRSTTGRTWICTTTRVRFKDIHLHRQHSKHGTNDRTADEWRCGEVGYGSHDKFRRYGFRRSGFQVSPSWNNDAMNVEG